MSAGTIEAPSEEAAAEAAAAIQETDEDRAERLAAEQAELDAQDHPDYPEGAADDDDEEGDGSKSLAETLAEASGIAAERRAGEALPAGEEAEAPLLGLSWADLIGGEEPTAIKIKLQGGAIEVVPPEDGLKKGSRHVLQVEVIVAGVNVEDSYDTETQDVTATVDTRKLKIRSARFIPTPSA